MERQQTQRLLYDLECKDCDKKGMCKWVDTLQCCRKITGKLRIELRNSRKHRDIIAKIVITTEYVYNNHSVTKTITKTGVFVLKDSYRFGNPFLRAEIQGKDDGGTFSTEYYKWIK